MSTDDISAIHQRLDAQDKTLGAIHSALVGNPSLGHKGLVAQVREHDEAILDHNSKLVRWGGMVAGATLALGLIKDKFLGGS